MIIRGFLTNFYIIEQATPQQTTLQLTLKGSIQFNII